ncbi:hypothetical protein Goklo_006355, partial [Gossypium klotzschianum]|nr:hypothetical protein [Gossypium klotzschianum]
MGRGRGKGKKLAVSNHNDAGNGEEEKIPSQKRRGRPQKPLKDNMNDEVENLEEGDGENGKPDIKTNERKSSIAATNGNKRKRNSQVKGKPDSVKEENGFGSISNTDDSSKANGFRQNGSRRKSKPRRAAEAVVECNHHPFPPSPPIFYQFPLPYQKNKASTILDAIGKMGRGSLTLILTPLVLESWILWSVRLLPWGSTRIPMELSFDSFIGRGAASQRQPSP